MIVYVYQYFYENGIARQSQVLWYEFPKRWKERCDTVDEKLKQAITAFTADDLTRDPPEDGNPRWVKSRDHVT